MPAKKKAVVRKGKKGGRYIVRRSKKTGKSYRKYL